ncbi:beta-eliminating lyase-related protein [Micromonospora musae]|uniref:threonine aldolase family protein n=1 Tax=Micromonospora musae TaxID=1894970 RepID=UPI0033CB1C76
MRACTRMLSGAAPMTVRERLADMADYGGLDVYPDYYGRGELLTLVESKMAEFFGVERAVFFPTGTLAQQVALRYWAERESCPVVAAHPIGHLLRRERYAVQALAGLRTVWPAPDPRIPEWRARHASAQEIADLPDKIGAFVLELPLRDAGFLLPGWDELTAIAEAVRSIGARLHIDGARLWETAPYLGRPVSAVAALADSTYVSLYKSLAGVSGAVLLGDAALARYAVSWRHRYGGDLFQQWPSAVAALQGLEREVPRIESYVAHARTVAEVLADNLPGARIHPEPPHTNQFQLWLPGTADELNEAALRLAEDDGLWFAGGWHDAAVPGQAMAEITIGARALELDADDVREMAEGFRDRLPLVR